MSTRPKSKLSNKIKVLAEEFIISIFIKGLKEELKIMVTMFKPNTLSAALGLAKLQEEVFRRSRRALRNHIIQH